MKKFDPSIEHANLKLAIESKSNREHLGGSLGDSRGRVRRVSEEGLYFMSLG
jgi:hypothetical protein